MTRYETIPCLLCGSAKSTPIFPRKEPRHVVCRDCGFVYLSPRPTEDTAFSHYEEGYWEGRAHEGIPKTVWSERSLSIAEWLRPHVKGDELVAEVGSGGGQNLACVKERLACRTLGIEPSHDQAAESSHLYGLEVMRTGWREAAIAERAPKAIVLAHVLEHIHDPVGLLTKLRDALAADGVLFIEVPNILRPHPQKRFSRWLERAHLYYFSPASLARTLRRAGLEVIRQQNDTFVRVLARPISEAARSAAATRDEAVENELFDVVRAVAQHEIFYWPPRIARRLTARFTEAS